MIENKQDREEVRVLQIKSDIVFNHYKVLENNKLEVFKGLEGENVDIQKILGDEEFLVWLKKNFFYFMKKEVLIEKYLRYLSKDEISINKLYSVYKDSNT